MPREEKSGPGAARRADRYLEIARAELGRGIAGAVILLIGDRTGESELVDALAREGAELALDDQSRAAKLVDAVFLFGAPPDLSELLGRLRYGTLILLVPPAGSGDNGFPPGAAELMESARRCGLRCVVPLSR